MNLFISYPPRGLTKKLVSLHLTERELHERSPMGIELLKIGLESVNGDS